MVQNDNQQTDGTDHKPPASRADGSVRVLQITDLHLFANPDDCLLGQNTRETLDLVLDLAVESCYPADHILLTGDLVHDESPAGYRYLKQRFAMLDIPCTGLPGNHDTQKTMHEILEGGPIDLEPGVRCGAWNLVLLDSSIPGQEGGHLDAGQLDLLRESLAAQPRTHTLVFLHHQPIPVGSRWLDTMTLDNPGDFFSIIDRNPQVRGIAWGHVHQEFNASRNGVTLLGAPSTCVQFLPGSEDFAVDALTPGLRWLDLHPDGRIETGIVRIAEYPQPLDLTTGGY